MTVHSAKVPDTSSIFWGSTDPVATVRIGAASKHTKQDRNTNHPRWEEDLTFTCVDKSLPILVGVIDKGFTGNNDVLLSVKWDDWGSALEAPPMDTAEEKLFKKEGSDHWVLLGLAASSPA